MLTGMLRRKNEVILSSFLSTFVRQVIKFDYHQAANYKHMYGIYPILIESPVNLTIQATVLLHY